MKKLLLAGFVLPALFLASCSSDEPIATVSNEGNVTFTAKLPGTMSRAYSDGLKATRLTYAVYDADTQDLIIESADKDAPQVSFSGLTATLSLDLVKGKTYDVVFWADDPDYEFYTFDSATKSIEINYENIQSGEENRDAFFQVVKGLKVNGAVSQPVELRRPFAQLNWGTDDIDKAIAAKVNVKSAEVTVSNVYNTLNLYSGLASGEVELTFAKADLPNETLETSDGVYTWLAMDYVLTGVVLEGDDVQSAQSEVIDAAITIYDAYENAVNTVEVSGVPVKRNYRTNIYGSLLTSKVDTNIEIKPGYNGENEVVVAPWDGKTIVTPAIDETAKAVSISSPAQFVGYVNMINEATVSGLEDYTVTLTQNLDFGGYEIPMIMAGATRSSSSASKAFSGTFDGNGKTISNFTINNDGAGNTATGFIASLSGTLKNVTFENVSISATTSEQSAIVGLLSNGGTVENVKVLSGTVSGTEATAGITGRILGQGTVKGCSNAATITATAHNTGGIVGAAYYNNNGMEIIDCTNSGDVTGAYGVGGIVGLNCGTISGCENTGAVSGNGSSIGGIVGEQQNSGTISNCTNTGAVVNNNSSSSNYGAGGIVGWIRYSGTASAYPDKSLITVTNCKNSASVEGASGVAGIVGMIFTYGTVENCVNTAPYIKASGTFASGLANQQTNDGSTVDTLGDAKVVVSNNVSTTELSAITGSCNALYIYINDESAVTAENNSSVLP